MIEAHLADRLAPRITLSREDDEPLETGGGVTRALPLLGDDPFYVVNADIAWEDGAIPALRRLADGWDDAAMDALLLLHPVATATGYDGVGDYAIDTDGRLRRRREAPAAPYVFTGIQLLHPRLFAGAPGGAFSLARLYDRAQESGRLFGIVHDGGWHHIGTLAGLEIAERRLAASSAGGG
jgi:MurNAc alpha-1-phosphate uridylyltransferase